MFYRPLVKAARISEVCEDAGIIRGL